MEIYLGIIIGLVIGVIASAIFYKQQLPKWEAQGFARAHTPEEKQKVGNMYSNLNQSKKAKSLFVPILIIATIFGHIIAWTPYKFIVLAVDLSFLLFFIIGISIISVIADKKIRASKNPIQS